MVCNSRQQIFPQGQPGACVPGILDVSVVGFDAARQFVAPACTGYADTAIANNTGEYVRVTLPAGNYVFEISAQFGAIATKKYTYYHCFKYNTLTGLWQVIDSAKKTIIGNESNIAARRLIHLKSDIITFTETKTVAYFHGVLPTEPTDGPFDASSINFAVYKL
jgi:hypothetical protein